jgi:ribosomal protein S18 acetylase RimI-like enzyme
MRLISQKLFYLIKSHRFDAASELEFKPLIRHSCTGVTSVYMTVNPSSPNDTFAPKPAVTTLTIIMTIKFRPAEPADVETAIQLIYLSGPNAFNFVFSTDTNGSAIDFLRKAYLDGAGEFGYRNHTVGTEDGMVVAIGGGWSGKNGLSFMIAAARQIFSQYGILCGTQVIIRGLRTEAVIPPPASDQFYLGHLGVLPEMQGRGIGQLLIHHLINQGKAAGFKVAALDVAVTNPRGQALYDRLGFVVTRERSSTLKNVHGYVADHRHMQMAIIE